MLKVVALKGGSRPSPEIPSLSLSVRIIEILDYLQEREKISYMMIWEHHERVEYAVDWAEAIIISKYVSAQTLKLVRLAKKRGAKIIYDIDDWIFSYPSYSVQHNKAAIDAIITMISLSDIVTVANQKIYDGILPYTKNVHILPGGVNVEKYFPPHLPDTHESIPPRIVFTNADLLKLESSKNIFIRALQVFFLRHPDYILDFIGDPFPEIFSLPFLHFNPRIDYPDHMANLAAAGYQFAIIPLGGREDPESLFFNSCKSYVKYLNYGATRVPGIYSSSPIYEESIIPGKTGLLAENTYESWIDALETMAADAVLRQSIRDNAYRDVLAKHHIRFSAEVLMDVLTMDGFTLYNRSAS